MVTGLFKVDVSQRQFIKFCSGTTKRNYSSRSKSYSAFFSMNINHIYLRIMPTILEGLQETTNNTPSDTFRILLLSRYLKT